MSTKIDDETNGCKFLWKIVNISHCWLKNDEAINSPTFIADEVKCTTWFLRLIPFHVNNIIIDLHRSEDCDGPRVIEANYRIDFINMNGEFMKTTTPVDQSFKRGGFSSEFLREKIFGSGREKFLPEDTLIIQCTIWKKKGALQRSQHLFAQTVFEVNRRSFVWKIEEFSTLKRGVKNKFKDGLLGFILVLTVGRDIEKKLIIDSISIDKSIKYLSFKTAVIDSEGVNEDCTTHEYFGVDLKESIFPAFLLTKKVLENKSRYLPNDVLTLNCEYVYSTGTALFEFCGCGITCPNATNVVVEKRSEVSIEKEKPPHTLVLANDLKSMYSDRICSDTELRTSTKIFPAHKLILIARSPVFRKMFSNNMKENICEHIDITDLEDDTVHRMLLYIYSDSLEDMQLENACKLYVASDKYEILSLRSRCSAFIKDNLCRTKACDVLVLADLHQDVDLKRAVQDYILKFDKEVFASLEWEQLMDSNPKLSAEIMYQKICSA